MDTDGSKTSIGVVIAVAVVALLAGFGGAKLMDRNNVTADTSMSNGTMATPAAAATVVAPDAGTKAGDLRAAAVSLGLQHMHLTDQAVDAKLDGNADAAAVKTQLVANGADISGVIGAYYGDAAKTQFQTLWNTHLGDFESYAVAGKKNDAAGKAAALADIAANYTAPIAKLLSGANPNLPNATLVTAFGDHVTMTAAVIDDHNAGNFAKEQTDLTAADTHIAGLMSTLAGAIVKQFPAKF